MTIIDSCEWLEPALTETQTILSSTNTKLNLMIHVTRDQPSNVPSLCEDSGDSELESSKDKLHNILPKLQGRPDLAKIIHNACTSEETDVAVAGQFLALTFLTRNAKITKFTVCGPDDFLYDVRNAVADCELGITKGAKGAVGCTNLYLHSENYG